MASLAMNADELRKEVGYALGYLRNPDNWSETQLDNIKTAIRDGIRRFFFNAVAPGTRKVYQWSFLRQNYLFSTAVGVDTYPLPQEFGSPIGPIIFNDASNAYEPVAVVNEAMVREKQAAIPSWKGVPTHAAIRSKRVTGATEQRQELLVFPLPDAVYPMRLGYVLMQGDLGDNAVELAGGAPHALTIKLACVNEGRKRVLNSEDTEADFQAALVGSISYDSRLCGDSLGYNGDPGTVIPEYQTTTRVTFNHVQY